MIDFASSNARLNAATSKARALWIEVERIKDGPNNNAVNSPGQNNSNAPVAGRNSFTEGQAKSKIEDAGYTNVTELKKDDNGIWRGKAKKGDFTMPVSVDFQGNVNTAK